MPLFNDPIDFKVDANGDLTIVTDLEFSSGVDAVVQGIERRLALVEGEWFANLEAGVDYYGAIWVKPFNELLARAEFRNAILATPGVGELLELELSFNSSTRQLTVSWQVLARFDDSDQDAVADQVLSGSTTV